MKQPILSIEELLTLSQNDINTLFMDTSHSDTHTPNMNTPNMNPSMNTPNINTPNMIPSMNPSSFIDVHTFDYSYKDLDLNLDMSNNEKELWLRQLIPRMKNNIAIAGVHMIIANIGHDANMDNTNRKSAEDILVKLTQYVTQCDESFIELIEEQMEDMVHLGQCAQGRTTRLWQLYCSIPKNEL